MNEKSLFGTDDNSYKAAGEKAGLEQLSKDFYKYMEQLPEAKKIREMHSENLDESIDKLALFLCGWLGGPRLFQEKYGSIHIPKFHSRFKIDGPEKEAWLLCMEKALQEQKYTTEFKDYLITQLRVPAERIQTVSQQRHKQ